MDAAKESFRALDYSAPQGRARASDRRRRARIRNLFRRPEAQGLQPPLGRFVLVFRGAVLGAALTAALVSLPVFVLAQATPPSSASAPEEVVRRYLEALRKEDFLSAYACVSKGMRRNKTREVWVAEVQALLRLSETTISAIRVFPGKIEGDKAFVPNLLHSKDKFINQLGLPEHELYTLVREAGAWKIDQQQLLEPSAQAKWFPADARDK